MFSPGSPVRIMRASSVELSRSQDPVSSALAVRDRRSVVVDADRREGFNDEFTLSRGVAAERMDLGTPAEAAAKIKRVARGFGADLTGSSHRGHSFSRRVHLIGGDRLARVEEARMSSCGLCVGHGAGRIYGKRSEGLGGWAGVMVGRTSAENYDVQSCPQNARTVRILEPKGAPAAGGTVRFENGEIWEANLEGVAAFLQPIGDTTGFQGPPVMP